MMFRSCFGSKSPCGIPRSQFSSRDNKTALGPTRRLHHEERRNTHAALRPSASVIKNTPFWRAGRESPSGPPSRGKCVICQSLCRHATKRMCLDTADDSESREARYSCRARIPSATSSLRSWSSSSDNLPRFSLSCRRVRSMLFWKTRSRPAQVPSCPQARQHEQICKCLKTLAE